MDRRFVLLVPLALLLIACMTCNTTTTLPSVSTQGAATAPSGGASTGDILLYSDTGGEAGSQIDVFPTTQHKLHFKTKVDALSKGQKIRWVFTAVAAGSLVDKQIGELKLDIPLDGVTTLSASLSNDTDWPSGSYKAEVYVDDNLVKSGDFVIVQPQ